MSSKQEAQDSDRESPQHRNGAVLDDIVDSPSSQYLSNGGSHEDERSTEQAFVSPLPKDPKSDKAEKKRLEQEKKDSEKQAKEQLKRQQKEEAKQKKDTSKADKASKEDISPNAELSTKKISSRKEERKENKEKRSLFSPAKKDGARPRNTVQCRVLLLDGSDCELQMDKFCHGQHLVDRVSDYVNILEKDYFSLVYRDKKDTKFWLRHDKSIRNQVGEGPWQFEFVVKFYPSEPAALQEDITRYQLCMQLRSDLLSGILPGSFVTYTLLGSYTAQSELGDYDPHEHGMGFNYIRDIQFAPDQTDELLEKIAELHTTHRGQTPAEAELHFLENAKKLGMYGVHLHAAKDSELVDIHVGVSSAGVIVFRDRLMMNRFVWPKILKISYKKNTFYLKIRPAEFERYESTIGFKLEDHQLTKRLWRITIEHHTFFRLKEPLLVNRGFFSDFGSKFRYSGRTYHQSRLASTSIDRVAPDFDRSFSKHMAGSRSMDYSAGNMSFDGRMHSSSMDLQKQLEDKRVAHEGYENDRSKSTDRDDNQVSVLAGSGPDDSRVAFVKTVRPGAEVNRRGDDLRNVSFEDETFEEPHGPQVGRTAGGRDLRAGYQPSGGTVSSSHTVVTSAEVIKDSAYGSENNGVLETRVERNYTITVPADETDIDHDLALAEAIEAVTDVNTDLTVETIEITTKPKKSKKPKKTAAT